MHWVLEWELGRKALYQIVLAEGLEPAACYRTVKRLTGLTWRTVRSRGIVSVLQDLRSRCMPPTTDRQRRKKEAAGIAPRRPPALGQKPYAHFGSPSLLAGASCVEPT